MSALYSLPCATQSARGSKLPASSLPMSAVAGLTPGLTAAAGLAPGLSQRRHPAPAPAAARVPPSPPPMTSTSPPGPARRSPPSPQAPLPPGRPHHSRSSMLRRYFSSRRSATHSVKLFMSSRRCRHTMYTLRHPAASEAGGYISAGRDATAQRLQSGGALGATQSRGWHLPYQPPGTAVPTYWHLQCPPLSGMGTATRDSRGQLQLAGGRGASGPHMLNPPTHLKAIR